MGVTTVRLQPELEAALKAAAVKLQRSRSWLINQALREYLEREAQADPRWQDTLAALDSVAAGDILPGDQVHAWLRSWGKPGETPGPDRGQ